MDTAIKICDLTKIYRKRHLGRLYTNLGVRNLSIEVYKGEVFGLLGLNGSGKTTTIKLILGLLFPTEGSIYIFDKLMPDKKIMNNIGYFPEIPYFQRFLTGEEILRFYSKLSCIREDIQQRINETVKIVNLKQDINKKVSEFSKGMLQRLGIAQSLLHNPDILVFDEPVSGLDPLGILEMRNLILLLRSKGKTIFFSSHVISEVEKVCDRVGILHKGELIKIISQNDWKQKSLEQIFIDSIKN